MKKYLLLFSVISCLHFTYATGQNIRIPNNSFEIWDTLATLTVPDSWPSSDLLWYFDGYNTRNVYPDRHCHSGKYSARMGPDTAAKKIWPGFITAKFAIRKMPEYFEFYYIDSLNKAESGAVKINLLKWNSAQKKEDSIGATTWNFPDSIIKNFVSEQIPIQYATVDTTTSKPDSISITIEVVSSSTSLLGGHIAVDDVSLVPHSSAIETPELTHDFELFPNPSNGLIYLVSLSVPNHASKVDVSDLNGRLLYSQYRNIEVSNKIDLSGNPPGIYFVKISSGDKVSVSKITINR